MTDKEPKERIVAHFKPQTEGEFLRNVPPRDLTQRDIDTMQPSDRRDAFDPHPLTGKPLYILIEAGKDKAADKPAEKDEG